MVDEVVRERVEHAAVEGVATDCTHTLHSPSPTTLTAPILHHEEVVGLLVVSGRQKLIFTRLVK
jgi:hypothetical protein